MRLAATVLALTGCLYIPYRVAAPGSRLEPIHTNDAPGEAATPVELNGATTREQVLLRLGEPDWSSSGQRIFVYTWQLELGAFVLFGNTGAVAIPYRGERHAFVVEFADDGTVTSTEVKRLRDVP